MSLFEKLLACDSRVIDCLTEFCWWTEVRFEKDNVHWALQTKSYECMVSSSAWCFASLQLMMTNHPVWAGVTIFFSLSFFSRILVIIFFKEIIRKGFGKYWPQGCPNPCRQKKIKTRIQHWFGFMLYTVLVFGTEETIKIFFGIFTISQFFNVTTAYLLCCDSMPPNEKAKRQARIESWDSQLVPNVS